MRSQLSDIVSSCEELRSPVPMAFVAQTTRFLFLFLFLLPLGLLQDLGGVAVLSEQLIGFALLGLQNVVTLLEAIEAI